LSFTTTESYAPLKFYKFHFLLQECGGIEDQSQGTMNHPSYNHRWWYIRCVWTLKAPSSTGMIVVLLEMVDVPVSQYNCR
jgi:hypothetical protein